MEERPVVETPTTAEPTATSPPEATATRPVPDRGSSMAVRLKSLIVLVLCCAAMLWAWRSIREGMHPYSGWIRILQSGNSEDRQVAAKQLGEADPETLKIAVPSLVTALGDKDEKVKAAVASALGIAGLTAMRIKPDGSEAAEVARGLTRALHESDEEVRASAAIAIAHLASAAKTTSFPSEPTPVAEALVDLLNDPSIKVRKLGRQALSEVGEAAKIVPPPALLEGLSQWKRTDSRAEAANALGSFKTGVEVSVPALIPALKDNEADVRSNAAVSLRKLGIDAVPALAALTATLEDSFVPPPPPPPRFPGIAGITLAGAATAEGEVVTDPAAEAARAIGQIVEAQTTKGATPPPEVIAGLTRAVQSSRQALKEAAEEALKKIGKGAATAIPVLIQGLTDSLAKPDPGFGSTAALLLGSIAPKTEKAGEAITALTAALDAKEATTRANAVQSLAKFGTAASAVLGRLRALGESEKDLASWIKTTIDRIEGKPLPEAPRRKGGGRRG